MFREHWWPALLKLDMKSLVVPAMLLLLGVAPAIAASPPTILRHPPDELFFHVPSSRDGVHRGVVLECEAQGDPRPDYKWTKNNHEFDYASQGSRILHQPGRGTLVITAPNDGDEGLYQCHATNKLGTSASNAVNMRKAGLKSFPIEDSKDVAVKKGYPPTIAEGPNNVTRAVVRSNVTLRCRALGVPRPDVLWDKDGQSLREARYHVMDSGDLRISGAQLADDGEYVCRATNKFGLVSASSLVEVQRRTRMTHRPPNDYEAEVGNRVTFRCGAETDPRRDLTIEWLFNGKPLDLAGNPRLVVLTDNSLAITRTVPLDAGKYTCLAHTRLDNDFADTTLIVQGVPSPPELLRVDCNSFVAVIEWKPTLEWGTPVLSYFTQYNTGFDGENWEDGAVNIPATETKSYVPMSPGANYTFRVLARNKYGYSPPSEASSKCSTPEGVPHKNPHGVMGRGERPDNLVISWTPMSPFEHNAPGFFYKVLWKRDDIPGVMWDSRNIEDWRQDHYVVDDQPTFKRYRIKVEAHNRRGQANTAAREVEGYSGEDVPLTAPADFRLVRLLDSRSAEFAWNPVEPETVRGHFRGYKIQTCTSEECGSTERESALTADATTAIVSIFRPYSLNIVRLRVFNDQHDGPATEPVELITPEGTPGPVASLEAISLGSTAFYLVWKPPSEVNGVLTGYRIFYQEVRGTDLGFRMERTPPVKDPLVLHAKLAGLKPRTSYRVIIRATTAEGPGDPYFVEARTGDPSDRLPDVPDFTWVLLPGGKDKEEVQVTWLPAIKGHPGSHFYVQYRRKGDETWEASMEEEYEDKTIVHGLEKGALYEMRVVAVDGKHERPSVIKEVDTGVTEKHAVRTASSFSTFKTIEKKDSLEVDASGNGQGIDQIQPHISSLLSGLDRQAKDLEELKEAVQSGFAELQRSLRRSWKPPAE
ncbi:neuroglian-like isoform X1 [Haemaphysalis longicornis]